MSLPFSLFGIHPREQEAPAWAKALCEGMGLVLENQDEIMSQIEDVKETASRLRSKIDRLRDAIEEMQSRPHPVQEPDMSDVLSELNATDADVDKLLASVSGPSEAEQPAADEPAAAQSDPLPESTLGTTTAPAGSQAGV